VSTSKLRILRINAHRANEIPRAKQMLQDIERSYYRLVEIEKWMVDQQQYDRPFAHFGLFNGRDPRTCFAMREDIVSLSADHSPKDH
jgi:hypothetical protein